MNTKSSRKAWVILLKESVLPLIISAVLFILFWLIYERYGTYYKEYLDKISVVLFIFLITYWVFKISVALFNWYAINIAAKTKTGLDDKFIPLFKRAAVAVIWAIGLIMVLSRLGININALVATLGVGSLAIALAAQDTIANIIAGFLIMIDRPFCIGDCIRLPSGEKVEVLDIGIRRTKFVSEEKAIIIVPNLDLSKSKIVNYTYGEEWKRNTER